MSRKRVVYGVLLAFAQAYAGCSLRGGETCESLLDNDCDRGCSCPKDFMCSVQSELGGNNPNHCFKLCDSTQHCPDKHTCAAVKVFLGGGETKIEGRCWAECSSEGKAGLCPEGGRCRQSTEYPAGGEVRGCE